MNTKELTSKQQLFAQLVASGKRYAEAYRESYSSGKMSQKQIWEESSKLMDNPNVAQRVEELRAEIAKNFLRDNQVTLEQVLEQMSNWIMFDPLDLIDQETECVKSLKDMDKKVRMSLAEIRVQELFENVAIEGTKDKQRVKIGELKHIKFVDKKGVADMFLKKFGAYIENKNVTIDNLDAIREIIESVKGK